MIRLLVVAGILAVTSAAQAADWPQWRGPQGTGISSEKDLPIIWNANRNLRWSSELPGWGNSTPSIWGDAVFVTSQTEDNRLLAHRVHKQSGQVEWTTQVGKAKPPRRAQKPQRGVQTFHTWQNLASPSPVTDGQYVVVHFGNGLLAGLDFQGKLLWSRNLQEDYGPYSIWWGHANSPVLVDGLVISICLQDALDGTDLKAAESYVVAHDVRDGHRKWRTLRPTRARGEQFDAYTTPLLVSHSGRRQLVVMGGNQLDAYDPQTGQQQWFLPNLIGGRTVTNPIAAGEMIYCTRGMRGPMLGVKVDRSGELPRRNIEWSYSTGTADSCSPVLWNELLFFISDDGIARCLDARFGTLKWKQRLKGQYKASPVVAGGRLYFLNTEGLCTVVSALGRFDKLTENQLDEVTFASPAISDGKILIRGKKRLYCIGPQQ